MTPPPKLFAAWFYIANNPGVANDRVQAWRHFCQTGFRQNLDPHPLFDTRFYRKKYLANQPDVNPLLHYVRRPGKLLQTHPLFDCSYFVDQLSSRQRESKADNETWLDCFLANNHEWRIDPSTSFCSHRYLEHYPDIAELNVSALFHYLAHGRKKGRLAFVPRVAVPALFDAPYYLRENPDVRAANLDPWQHYCEFGNREDRNPNPVFHNAFYRDKYLDGDDSENALMHYLGHQGEPLDTHPLFCGEFYLSQLNSQPADMTPLEHFLQFNGDNLASPSPLFCSKRYLEYHSEINRQTNPLYEYLSQGQAAGRRTFFDVQQLEAIQRLSELELELLSHFPVPNAQLPAALKRLDGNRPTLLCVSHAASKTGAPLIILKLAEQFKAQYNVNIFNILCQGGDLVSRFETLGPTVCLQDSLGSLHPFDQELIESLLKTVSPFAALVNSAESRHLLPELARLRIPIHSLVHENARCYQPEAFAPIAKHSDRVIFPCQYVADAAEQNTAFPKRQEMVLPQGLLNPNLLTMPRHSESGLREKWNIPSNATLVLGCGTGDGRKGLDLFVATALSTLNRMPENSIVFGWLGEMPTYINTEHAFWAIEDVVTAGRQANIRFFGPTDNAAAYFQACDIFFLPSRMDPFPCVVNEAMAAGKPVILFDGGSGCVDIVAPDGGAAPPYGDVASATESICELAKDPQQREQMGDHNRQYVGKHLQFSDYTHRIAESIVESFDLSRHRSLPAARAFRDQVFRFHSDRQRIIFTLPAWNVSGVNTFVENLIHELRARDYDASILFTTRDPDRIDRDLMPTVPYRFLSSRTLSPAETRCQLEEYLRANAPCVFVPNYDYAVSSIASQLPDNVGVLGVLHCDEDEHYLHAYRMGHYWDAIVAVSPTVRSRLLQLNPAFEKRLTTIPYGVPVPADRTASPMYSSVIRMVYCGRLVQKQKRIFDFVELASILEARNVPFQLTMIGDGPAMETLSRRMQPLIEQGLVRMPGRLTHQQVLEELEQHDVFTLMSDYEGLPLSLLEAMAVECVPVVTDVESGINEILRDQNNAMISPRRDPAAMAKNIIQLQGNPGMRISLGQAARQTLHERRLSSSGMADQYQVVLDKIFRSLEEPRLRSQDIPLDCPEVRMLLDAA
ncbi:MAG: glycosyltransferase family 4 protein [Mariniblastus sp.]|nr:glycosyltransferase family 4 protein [Mariniblastus sp.]